MAQFPLYKYHRINEHFYDLLINQALFCCSRFNLNDPHEGFFNLSDSLLRQIINRSLPSVKKRLEATYPNISITEEMVLNFATDSVKHSDVFDIIHKGDFAELLNVCSFSETSQQELMWAHYADNFKGVCLEFDFSNESEISALLSKVSYSNVTPEISELTAEELFRALSVKRDAWAYEKEWRILIPDRNKISFAPTSLRAIWFGVRTSQEKMDTIRKLCRDNALSHVEFKQLELKIAAK